MSATSRRIPPNALITADAETRAVLATCRALASSGLRVTADEEVFVHFNPRVYGSPAPATPAGVNHSSDSGPAIAHFLLESCDQFGWVARAEPESFRYR